MNPRELSEQEVLRRNSMAELRRMGIEPYPAAEYPVSGHSDEIKANFTEDGERREVSVAGRIMSRRIMGKASFVELQDARGRIQIYISRDDICPGENKDLYNIVFKKLLDIGDFIGVRGYVFRTQTGEISVHAQELTVLSKSLRPLPIVKMKDGVKYDAEKGVWNGGRVYDPTKGKSYKVEVSFEDDRTLRVKGSLLGFSRSVYWQKIE